MLIMTPVLLLGSGIENILFYKLLDLTMNFKLPAGLTQVHKLGCLPSCTFSYYPELCVNHFVVRMNYR